MGVGLRFVVLEFVGFGFLVWVGDWSCDFGGAFGLVFRVLGCASFVVFGVGLWVLGLVFVVLLFGFWVC